MIRVIAIKESVLTDINNHPFLVYKNIYYICIFYSYILHEYIKKEASGRIVDASFFYKGLYVFLIRLFWQ